MNTPTIEEFKKFKEKVGEFITKDAETFYFRNLMESIHDPNYMREVDKIIDYVKDNRNAEEIEELFKLLRNKCEIQFINAENVASKEEKMNYSLRGLAYFCLVEALNENSSFSEKIIEDIKKKYGEKYLDVIAKIDKAVLSVDGKKIIEVEDTEIPDDEEIKKYLVMKKWQDEQRLYSMKRIRPFYSVELEYINESNQNLMLIHKKTLLKRAREDMLKEGLVPIEEIAEYYEAGLEPELTKLVGGKALGLSKLKAAGANIPTTYVIPIGNEINEEELEKKLNSKKSYAVRSSADVEDGGKYSFAGMFESFLNVQIKDIYGRIKEVKKSTENRRVTTYTRMNQLQEPSMGVIIQEFREPEIAGVWIGRSKDEGILEWVNGNGEKLVSGKENPIREVWEKNKCETETPIYAEGNIGQHLLKIQQKLANRNSDIADIEWCVLDGKMILLQYRPVTRELENEKIDKLGENDYSNEIFIGSPASAGEISGDAKYYRNLSDITEWNEGDILISMFTDPDWMEIMSKSSGLVTAVGGLLCHSAIIARELGIPCVTGVGREALKKLKNEKKIYLNGTTGEVCSSRVHEYKKKGRR